MIITLTKHLATWCGLVDYFFAAFHSLFFFLVSASFMDVTVSVMRRMFGNNWIIHNEQLLWRLSLFMMHDAEPTSSHHSTHILTTSIYWTLCWHQCSVHSLILHLQLSVLLNRNCDKVRIGWVAAKFPSWRKMQLVMIVHRWTKKCHCYVSSVEYCCPLQKGRHLIHELWNML